jgi:rubrerythrin
LLEGGAVEVQGSFPAGVIGTTVENLQAAVDGENEEWEEMYPSFAKVAREEGFDEIAEIFDAIAVAEKQHEKRFKKLLSNIKDGTVFRKGESVLWQCRNCGYVHEGKEAPETCPACAHPQDYFELLAENW